MRSGGSPLHVAYGRRAPEDVSRWATMLADERSVAEVTRSIAAACLRSARGHAADRAEAAALLDWVAWAVDDVRTRLGLLPCSPDERAGLVPAPRLLPPHVLYSSPRPRPRRWLPFPE